MNIYSGPADKIEIDDNVDFSSATNLGEAKDIKITWEPTGTELMDGSETQNGGMGKVECFLAEGGSTTNTALKAARNVRQWVRVTLADATTRIIKNVLLQYGYSANLSDPADVVGFPITTEKWTDEPDDFCSVPTD